MKVKTHELLSKCLFQLQERLKFIQTTYKEKEAQETVQEMRGPQEKEGEGRAAS